MVKLISIKTIWQAINLFLRYKANLLTFWAWYLSSQKNNILLIQLWFYFMLGCMWRKFLLLRWCHFQLCKDSNEKNLSIRKQEKLVNVTYVPKRENSWYSKTVDNKKTSKLFLETRNNKYSNNSKFKAFQDWNNKNSSASNR